MHTKTYNYQKITYNDNRYGGNIKETTTPPGSKYKSKASRLSSMNDEEILIPQGTINNTGTGKEWLLLKIK